MRSPGADARSLGMERQLEIYRAGAAGRRPPFPVTHSGLKKAARKALSKEAYGYVAGGAGTEDTARENRATFRRWRIVPRHLRGVAVRDLAIQLFGRRLEAPLLLAPIGALGILHEAAAIQRFAALFANAGVTWDDLATLREMTDLPIVLKGILHPDDARRGLDAGADGVLVSNHGGRQVDGAIAALDALPGVVEAVDDRAPVLFDSGIRTGADVFKVLALGAAATLLGRPYAYVLAVGGEEAVRETLLNLLAELDLTVGMSGCRSVGEIGPDLLVRHPG